MGAPDGDAASRAWPLCAHRPFCLALVVSHLCDLSGHPPGRTRFAPSPCNHGVTARDRCRTVMTPANSAGTAARKAGKRVAAIQPQGRNRCLGRHHSRGWWDTLWPHRHGVFAHIRPVTRDAAAPRTHRRDWLACGCPRAPRGRQRSSPRYTAGAVAALCAATPAGWETAKTAWQSHSSGCHARESPADQGVEGRGGGQRLANQCDQGFQGRLFTGSMRAPPVKQSIRLSGERHCSLIARPTGSHGAKTNS